MKIYIYNNLLFLLFYSLIFGCSNQLYLHEKGYGPIEVGMRIDIAYKNIGETIAPKDALTAEDMKCFYAYIGNTSDSLVLTVINSHILRFDCNSKVVSTDEDIRVGDHVQKVIINYGKVIKKRGLNYLKNNEYSLSVKKDNSELIFVIKNDLVEKIIVGDLQIVNQKDGCK